MPRVAPAEVDAHRVPPADAWRESVKKTVLTSLTVAFVAGVAWLTLPSRPPQPTHLVDRVWIDHLPKSPTDLISHLVVLKERQGHVGGVLGRSSEWRIGLDLFSRKLGPESMEMYFPQRNERVRVGVRTWKCKGEAPEPFELCLELKADRRLIRLYSREDWIIPEGVPAELQHLMPSLETPRASGDDDGGFASGGVAQEALPRALVGYDL